MQISKAEAAQLEITASTRALRWEGTEYLLGTDYLEQSERGRHGAASPLAEDHGALELKQFPPLFCGPWC